VQYAPSVTRLGFRELIETAASGLIATLTEITRRAGNARLPDREVDESAAAARDRTRRLQTLTTMLSGALETHHVVRIMVGAGHDALGAAAAFAWLLRNDALELFAWEDGGSPGTLEQFRTIPPHAKVPVWDVIRTGKPMMFENLAAMRAGYPNALRPNDSAFRAWAVMPIFSGQRAIGAVSFSFARERRFSDDDRELLLAMIGQASLALERCQLFEAERSAHAEAEAARERERQLHRLGSSFASELDHARLVQLITDEIRKLVGAEVGAFFYPPGSPEQRAIQTLSPSTTDAREPRWSNMSRWVAQAFAEQRVMSSDDVLSDPRFLAHHAPHGEAPVARSCLAIPVLARSGEVFGVLWFGHAEIGRFTKDHEQLAANVASQAAVALENARLYATVREQKELLEMAVERARLADRRKDEFLAMLGHELRNPLAPIVTALALMELKSNGTLQNERAVIRRQVDHLTRLVNDLLDVSRITRGKIQLNREVLEIGSVLAKAIEMASPLLEKQMQKLVIDVPTHGLAVNADASRLAQVFQNLLTNAAKYSDKHSKIELSARKHGEEVIIEVRDQGIGISPELKPRLFDLFVQGERALDRSEGGLGIGLSVAKSLCELHSGKIEVSSEGVGRGSTFTVTVPLASQETPAVTSGSIELAPRSARTTRVLVVDDNIDAARTLQELLTMRGHEVAVASDGLSALNLAREFRPLIALLDIGLPVIDGYELCRRLQEELGRDAVCTIAVTGYGQDSDGLRAREAGFDHHLVKPVALDALIPLIESDRVA
jgi:signal transduction histidine kinase